MKKIILIIVVIVLIAVVIYLYMTKSSVDTSPGEVVNTIDTAKSISDVVDKSNPFDVKVDPYQGYKNPFN